MMPTRSSAMVNAPCSLTKNLRMAVVINSRRLIDVHKRHRSPQVSCLPDGNMTTQRSPRQGAHLFPSPPPGHAERPTISASCKESEAASSTDHTAISEPAAGHGPRADLSMDANFNLISYLNRRRPLLLSCASETMQYFRRRTHMHSHHVDHTLTGLQRPSCCLLPDDTDPAPWTDAKQSEASYEREICSTTFEMSRPLARMGESRNAYRVLVGRSEEKRPLGRPRRRWEDNIKMDLREVGYDDRDWLILLRIGTDGRLV
ncbi:hypothetical protein ANN_18550 [Periplaneta americana]|uniref:Uncharacterized protein n=1 Tax=Periplaneta americana TaxID=6978 RepID=A0ABQ8SP22_PERAM|nr:hypothetical protein ANN_18550 [Periplaneta americana]